jgi:hypothetical protein
LKERLNKKTDYIKEHFVNLRNKVQLATEELHKQINDLNEQVIIEINEYEKELIEFDKTNIISSKSLEVYIKEFESFETNYNQLAKLRKFNNEKFDKLNQDAIELKEKSSVEISKLTNIILNGKYVNFKTNKEKLSKSLLGETKITTNINEIDSIILTDKTQINQLMSLCEFPSYQKWKLIYRASQDGFESAKFHSKCDNKRNTFIIIKSRKGNIFGGYTEETWNNYRNYKSDQKTFIFSLINKLNRPIKIKSKNENNVIGCDNDIGPSFGRNDLVIVNKSNTDFSYSNLGLEFVHPDYAYESNDAKSFLAGEKFFMVLEIEVYTKK